MRESLADTRKGDNFICIGTSPLQISGMYVCDGRGVYAVAKVEPDPFCELGPYPGDKAVWPDERWEPVNAARE